MTGGPSCPFPSWEEPGRICHSPDPGPSPHGASPVPLTRPQPHGPEGEEGLNVGTGPGVTQRCQRPPVLMLAPSLLGAGPGECRAGLTRLQASGDPFWSLLPQSKAWAGGGTAAPHAHSRTGGMSRRGKVLVHAEASGRPGGRTSARWPFREGPLAAGTVGERGGRPHPPLLRSPVPGPLGPALVTKQSAGRSSGDCALCPPESGRAEPARGRGPHPHVPCGRRWGPHSGGSPHPFARHRAGYRPAYRGPRSESW